MKKVGEKNAEKTLPHPGRRLPCYALHADTVSGVTKAQLDDDNIDDLREFIEFSCGESFHSALPYCSDGQVLLCLSVEQEWYDIIKNEYGIS